MKQDISRRACLQSAGVSFLAGAACRRARPLDELVLLNEAGVRRLDPRHAATTWEVRLSRLIAPGLAGPADLEEGDTPGLAERIWPDEGQGAAIWYARLSPAARFPDGRAVDAEDVRYTFASILDPDLQSSLRQTLARLIARVEIIDARTVRFILHEPYAPFVSQLETGIVDRHVMAPLDEAVRAAVRAGRALPPLELAREVTGAGPYRLEARTNDRVELLRNEHARVRPATRRLVVRTIADDNARVLALMGGSGDVVINGVTELVLETLEKRRDLHVLHAPSATVTYLGFNLRDPRLADASTRRAIAATIERERLIAARFRGRAVPADSFLPRGHWAHAANPVDGPGGLPQGTLELRTSNNRSRVALAQAIARPLSTHGLAVEVRPFEFATLMHDVRHGNFQLFVLQLTGVLEPDMLRQLYHSAAIPAPENGWSGLNRFGYRDGEVDGWLDEAARVPVRARRRDLYARVQARVARDVPAFPLWHEDNVMIHRRGLSGLALGPAARLEGLLRARRQGSGA